MHALQDTEPFYRTALLALVAQEHHEPTARRFGPEADSAWSMFHGHLNDADRIDLLIRDAAVRHPAAFAPRTAFAFADLPDDEPFGPHWQSPFGVDTGRRAWRETAARLGTAPRALWTEALASWRITPEPLELSSKLDNASRVLVIGTTAIAALAGRVFDDSALDWGRQIVAVASEPAGVQLAGIVPLIAGTKVPSRALALTDTNARDARAVLASLDSPRPDIIVGSRIPTSTEQGFIASLRAAI